MAMKINCGLKAWVAGLVALVILVLALILALPAMGQGPFCEPTGPVGTYGAICVQDGIYCIINDDLKLCAWETPSYKHFLCAEGETEAVTVNYHVESRAGGLMDRADITINAGKTEDLYSICPPWNPGCVPTLIPKSYDMVNTYGGIFTPQNIVTSDAMRYNFTPSNTLDFKYDILAIANGPSLNFYAEPTIFSDSHRVTTMIGGAWVTLSFPIFADGGLIPGPWLGEYEYAYEYCEAVGALYLPLILKLR
jgi:hypothetical protein